MILLTIQQVGTEIMKGNPRKFYVMTGSEYGIKKMYIKYLKDHYNHIKESDSVDSVFSLMNTKHFIPLDPAVYVIRYDEDFITSLNDKTSQKIRNTNIIGTVVCLYELDKHVNRVEKYLGDYTVHIDKVSKMYIKKYLSRDFPLLSDSLLDIVVDCCNDWYEAELMCKSMMFDDMSHINAIDKNTITSIFGKNKGLDDKYIKSIIASKNLLLLLSLLDQKEGQEDSILYAILSTMLELEKLSCNKYVSSDLRPYLKLWTLKDIYNMFMNTYNQLNNLRTVSANPRDIVMYLIYLLQFKEIPDIEVM